MGRILVAIGGVLVVAGLVVMGLERAGIGLGRLPGDFVWRGRHTTVYAPLGTSLLLSVLLSLLLYALGRMRR
jgi:hypothetical protein